MTVVVIAAHNEAPVIGRCLDALLADALPGELDVVVAANGCTDATAAVAAERPGVTVLESPTPGKTAALNQADRAVPGSPRIYLDADMVVDIRTVRAVQDALVRPGGPLAVVPGRTLDLRGRPLLVRAYFAINARLPVYRESLLGRGMIGLSAAGRNRFADFPDVVADDLFLDSLFTTAEREHLTGVSTTVATPRRTRDLAARLVRVRRSSAALRASGGAGGSNAPRSSDRTAWLRDVVLPHPWLAPAGVVYAGITGWAAWQAARTAGATTWERDESSRTPTPA